MRLPYEKMSHRLLSSKGCFGLRQPRNSCFQRGNDDVVQDFEIYSQAIIRRNYFWVK
jgi:hypothetical protein